MSESFYIVRIKTKHATAKNLYSLRVAYFFTLERPSKCILAYRVSWTMIRCLMISYFNNSIINPLKKRDVAMHLILLCKPTPPFVDTRRFMPQTIPLKTLYRHSGVIRLIYLLKFIIMIASLHLIYKFYYYVLHFADSFYSNNQ